MGRGRRLRRLCLRKLPQYSRKSAGLCAERCHQVTVRSLHCSLLPHWLCPDITWWLLQQYFLLISGVYFWNLFTFKWVSNKEPTFLVCIQSQLAWRTLPSASWLSPWWTSYICGFTPACSGLLAVWVDLHDYSLLMVCLLLFRVFMIVTGWWVIFFNGCLTEGNKNETLFWKYL